MKSTSFLILFLYLLSSCQTPEWKKRGFESEYNYNEYINDSIEKANKIFFEKSYASSSVVATFTHHYISNIVTKESETISISYSGILRSHYTFNGGTETFYKVDYKNSEFWDGAVYGKGIDLAIIDEKGRTGHIKFEEDRDGHVFRYDQWKLFWHWFDGSKDETPNMHTESPYLYVFWNYLKENYPMNFKDFSYSENPKKIMSNVDTSTLIKVKNNKLDIKNESSIHIGLTEATKIYEKFSSAIRKEDVDLLKTYLAPTLDVWHNKSNIDRESLISNWEVNYVSKWSVSKDILIDIEQGDKPNKYIYKKSYSIYSKKDKSIEKQFEISGYFILNKDKQIVEMKDEVTKRLN
jgi:hypothetical protein